MVPVNIGPAEISFDTKHPPADLIVEADLAAADEAIDIVRAQWANTDRNPVLVAPSAAEVTADVEASPIVDCGGGSERRFPDRQVSGQNRAGQQGAGCGAGEQNVSH